MTTNAIYQDPVELAMLVDEFNFMSRNREFADDAERDTAITLFIDEYLQTGYPIA